MTFEPAAAPSPAPAADPDPAAPPDLQPDAARTRCFGGDDPLYARYHDEEWGRPVHGDQPLFERIALEGFQAGLSWITVLRRRETFRAAFAGFDPTVVAGYDERDVERLMGDPGIVRNRAKILATIANAQALLALQAAGDSLDALIWSYAPPPRTTPVAWADVPASTPESVALSRELKRRGFAFVGPTTIYAAMQACGLVDDHVAGCWLARG